MTLDRIERKYRAHIYEDGDDNSIDFTIEHFADPPEPITPIIQGAALNRAERVSFSVRVIDKDNIVSDNMTDGDGSMNMAGRRIQIQHDVGNGWEDLFGGRVSSINLDSNIGVYNIHVQDEMSSLADKFIFDNAENAPTTQVWPHGVRSSWRGLPEAGHGVLVNLSRIRGNFGGLHRKVTLTAFPDQAAMIGNVAGWIESASQEGKLWLKFIDPNDGESWWRVNSVTFSDTEFWEHISPEEDSRRVRLMIPQHPLRFVNPEFWPEEALDPPDPQYIEQDLDYFDGRIPSQPYQFTGIINESFGVLMAPEAEASGEVPIHTGIEVDTKDGASQPPWSTNNPITLIKNLFDRYDIRYDADNLAHFEDVVGEEYKMTFRVTEPSELIGWLASNILDPLGLGLVPKKDGSIKLVNFRLPNFDDITEISDVDETHVFTESNTREPHPTWDNSYEDSVNKVNINYHKYTWVDPIFGERFTFDNYGADRLGAQEMKKILNYDDDDNKAARSREINMFGFMHPSGENQHIDSENVRTKNVISEGRRVGHELFERYGPGAIVTDIHGFYQDSDHVEVGDIVRVEISSFPNPSEGRGGQRLVQVVRRRDTVRGPVFRVEDLGPALNPLPSPNLSLTLDDNDNYHSIEAEISNIPESAQFITIRVDRGDGEWETVNYMPVSFLQPEFKTTINRLPSGTNIGVKVRVSAIKRMPSSWTESSITTASIDPPFGLSAESEDSSHIILSFTASDEDYDITPVLDGENFQDSPIPGDSEEFEFSDLAPNTTYNVGVKHVDGFGGSSDVASISATSGGSRTLRAPRKILFRQAKSNVVDAPPKEKIKTFGFEVQVVPREPSAFIFLQVARDVDFTDVVKESGIDPGQDRNIIELPRTSETLYVRARHEREGFDDSTWSPVIRGIPTTVQKRVDGPDKINFGYAFLSDTEEHEVVLNTGTFDPHTDRVYYELSKDDFVEPTDDEEDESPFIEREDMPYSEIVDFEELEMDAPEEGDQVFLWARFWDEEEGFAPEAGIKHRIVIGADPSLRMKPEVRKETEEFREDGRKWKRLAVWFDDPFERLVRVEGKTRSGDQPISDKEEPKRGHWPAGVDSDNPDPWDLSSDRWNGTEDFSFAEDTTYFDYGADHAQEITNTGASDDNYMYQNVSDHPDNTQTIQVLAELHTTSRARISTYDETANAHVALLEVSDGGTASVTDSTEGSVLHHGYEDLGSGPNGGTLVAAWANVVASNPGNSRTLRVYPADVDDTSTIHYASVKNGITRDKEDFAPNAWIKEVKLQKGHLSVFYVFWWWENEDGDEVKAEPVVLPVDIGDTPHIYGVDKSTENEVVTLRVIGDNDCMELHAEEQEYDDETEEFLDNWIPVEDPDPAFITDTKFAKHEEPTDGPLLGEFSVDKKGERKRPLRFWAVNDAEEAGPYVFTDVDSVRDVASGIIVNGLHRGILFTGNPFDPFRFVFSAEIEVDTNFAPGLGQPFQVEVRYMEVEGEPAPTDEYTISIDPANADDEGWVSFTHVLEDGDGNVAEFHPDDIEHVKTTFVYLRSGQPVARTTASSRNNQDPIDGRTGIVLPVGDDWVEL